MRALLTTCFAFVLYSISAQNFELTSINLTVQDGLAGDNVYCALQDDKGYIWFGTETGVSRYNGREFENFYMSDGLGDNEVFRIDQDSQGRIWFSAFNGKISYYLDGKFYGKHNQPSLAKINTESYYVNIYEDGEGSIWFGTAMKVVVLLANGEVNEVIGKEGRGLGVQNFMEREGKVWGFSSRNFELELSNTSKEPLSKKEYTDDDGLDIFLEYLAVQTTYLDPFNRTVTRKYLSHLVDSVVPNSVVITKTLQYEGEQWFCTYEGTVRATGKTKPEYFFRDEMITHVLKDREQGYWFTTLGNGVFYVPSLNYKSVSEFEGKPIGMVSSMLDDGESVWFGGSGGKFGSILNEKVTMTDSDIITGRAMAKNIIRGPEESSFLVAAESQLIYFKNYAIAEMLTVSAKVIKKWNGLYVLGNRGFLMVLDEEQLKNWLKAGQGVINRSKFLGKASQLSTFFGEVEGYVIDVEEFGDDLLLGTTTGLYLLDSEFNYSKLSENLIMNQRINDVMVIDENSYALATHGFGTFVKREGDWIKVSMDEGLKSNISRKLIAQGKDTLWIATNGGVSRVVLNDKEPVVSNLTKTDGLLTEEVYDLLIKDGRLHAGTGRGISMIDLTDWQTESVAPLINFRSILADGQPFDENNIRLKYSTGNLELRFDGIHFRSLDRVSYEYKTIGLDNTWKSTSNNSISFGKLAPGDYQFQVRTVSALGNKSEVIGRGFTILRPFWLQWWFLLAAGISVVLLFVWLVRIITNRNRRKTQRDFEFKLRIAEAERKALQSQLNPHFIFNSLNSIQKMVLQKNPEAAYNYLEKFGKLIRRVLELSDISMITILDELDTLKLYMDLENLRLGDKFDYEISIGSDVKTTRLIPSLIIQPYIENSIWHGITPLKNQRRGKIDIEITNDRNDLIIGITDNGVGREPNLENKGLGTKIVNELVGNFRGEQSGDVYIEDLRNGDSRIGTRVKIRIRDKKMIYDKSPDY